MMTQSKIDHYVSILKNDVANLDKEIQQLHKNYHSDLEVERLKKIRLHKKDMINSLKGSQ